MVVLLLAGSMLCGCGFGPLARPPVAATPAASASGYGDVVLLEAQEVAALFASSPGSFPNADGTYRLSIQDAGVLHLPSGAVVASDPGFSVAPFAARLAVGTASVRLLRAAPPGDATSGFVADAVLVAGGYVGRLDDLHWENALRVGDDPAAFGPNDVVIYGVDSGTGSFASAEAATALLADLRRFSDRLLEAEKGVGYLEPVTVDAADGLEVVAFPSGAGDGGYPTWVGRDAGGTAQAFLTDFGILAHPEGWSSGSPGPSVSLSSDAP